MENLNFPIVMRMSQLLMDFIAEMVYPDAAKQAMREQSGRDFVVGAQTYYYSDNAYANDAECKIYMNHLRQAVGEVTPVILQKLGVVDLDSVMTYRQHYGALDLFEKILSGKHEWSNHLRPADPLNDGHWPYTAKIVFKFAVMKDPTTKKLHPYLVAGVYLIHQPDEGGSSTVLGKRLEF